MRTAAAFGQVIVLNGTSSAGKTSLAEALLEVLPTPWFHLGVDVIGAMRAVGRTRELREPALGQVLDRTRAGHAGAVAAMARAGNDVVADVVLGKPERLVTWLTVTEGLAVLFVGVTCPLEALERRERARGDRHPGQGAAQLALVHAHGRYDVVVDTSTDGPVACAERVAERLEQLRRDPETPRAFDRLRRTAGS